MGTHVDDPHAACPELDDPISWESSRRFLRFVILFSLVGATVYFAALQLISPEQRSRAVVVGAMQALCLVAWVLHSRGRVRSSVWLMSVGVWTYVTVAAIFFGGVSASVVIVYVPVILLNGWLIGDRPAVIAAVLAGVASLAMAIAETAGRLPVAPVTSPLLRWMVLAFIFVICATLMASAARSYRSRLNEVRKLTEELAHRTADLDRAQAVAHVGSWIYDLATDAMHISPEACRIFGVGVGTTGNLEMYRSRVHPADQEALRHAWTVALADATAFDCEHRVLIGDTVRWVRQRAEFERQPDGSPHRAVGPPGRHGAQAGRGRADRVTQPAAGRRRHGSDARVLEGPNLDVPWLQLGLRTRRRGLTPGGRGREERLRPDVGRPGRDVQGRRPPRHGDRRSQAVVRRDADDP